MGREAIGAERVAPLFIVAGTAMYYIDGHETDFVVATSGARRIAK